MEIVGSVASIVQLIGLVGRSATLVSTLRNRYQDAPGELTALAHQMECVRASMVLIEKIISDPIEYTYCLSQHDRDYVHGALLSARANLLTIYDGCVVLEAKSASRRTRIRWALQMQNKVQDMRQRLESTESSVQTILQILNICSSSKATAILQDMNRAAIETRLGPRQIPTDHPEARIVKHRALSSKQSALSMSRGWNSKLGLSLSVFGVERTKSTSYRLSVASVLPLLTRRKRIVAEIAMKFGRPWYQKFTLTSHLSTSNVISPSSDAVRGCLDGDLALLQSLFSRRLATPTDSTDDSRPLIWYAIRGGSYQAVRFLLNEGADATMLNGPYHSDLLAIAMYVKEISIARLLVAHGTDVNHISSIGVSPILHLYNPGVASASLEFLEMVMAHGFDNINAQSHLGWTALHRAAGYGTAEDICQLCKFGADTSLRTYNEGWSPIFCAVEYGNIKTFQELAASQPDLVDVVDFRGWTLLHIAASHGHVEIMDILVCHGANPHIRTPASQTLEAPELRRRFLTAGDLAAYHSDATLGEYQEILQRFGFDVWLSKSCDGEADIFWSWEEPWRASF